MKKYLPITITLVISAILVAGMVFAAGRGQNNPSSNNSPSSEALYSGHSTGPSNAKVTLTEFGDYQCPACKAAEPAIEQLRNTYKGKVNFIFKNFPLTQVHQYAYNAALAAEASYNQGKFWQMHDELYKLSPDLQDSNLQTAAKTVGLNITQFNKDESSISVKKRVDDDIAFGNKENVTGTPTIYINGQLFTGDFTNVNAYKQVIDPLLQ